MDKNLNDLVRISHHYGKNPEFVIAGGGNTSYKNADKIWVKSSGSSMATITTEDFVCLDRKTVRHIATKNYSNDSTLREQQVKKDLYTAILYPKEKRPSVETSMHEIIEYPFVVHTHPTLVNGLLCATDSKSVVDRLFGDDVLYVEYTDPGYVLFKAVEKALILFKNKKGTCPKSIFLENHGIFVAADTIREVEEIYNDITKKIVREIITTTPKTLVRENSSALDTLAKQLGDSPEFSSLFIMAQTDDLSQFFVSDPESFSQINKPFTPDNIVYCRSNYLYVDDETDMLKEFTSFNDKFGYYPKVIAIKGKGILAIEEDQKAAAIVLDVFSDMMKIAFMTKNFGGPRHMTKQQIEFIDTWEVENYRRKVSKRSNNA